MIDLQSRLLNFSPPKSPDVIDALQRLALRQRRCAWPHAIVETLRKTDLTPRLRFGCASCLIARPTRWVKTPDPAIDFY